MIGSYPGALGGRQGPTLGAGHTHSQIFLGHTPMSVRVTIQSIVHALGLWEKSGAPGGKLPRLIRVLYWGPSHCEATVRCAARIIFGVGNFEVTKVVVL